MVLSSNPLLSAAEVAQVIQRGDSEAVERSSAVEAMSQRLTKLKDPDGEQVTNELLAHACILDSLFQRFTTEALTARQPESRVKFLKTALTCQTAYTRTLIAVEGLKVQRKGSAAVTLQDDGGDHGSGEAC